MSFNTKGIVTTEDSLLCVFLDFGGFMSSLISSCQNKSDSSDMETCVGLNGDIYMNYSGNFLDAHIVFIICASEDFRLHLCSTFIKSMSGSLFSPEIKSVSTGANIFGVSKGDS